MNTTTNIGQVASEIAIKAALQYLRNNGLTADSGALAECLRSHVKMRIHQALADAKEAIDAHMEQAAEATFAASMAIAGIEAAKEAGFPA